MSSCRGYYIIEVNEIKKNKQKHMSEQNNNKQDVTTYDILDFLKDHMVTKEEFNGFKDKIEGRLDSIENRLIYLTREIADIKSDLKKLSERTLEDSDAHAKDILKLQRRVEKMEKEMTQMRLAYQH